MATNYIKKLDMDERIRLCGFKHQGDVAGVATELEVPLDYVRKILSKLKKQLDRDVKYKVAYMIMGNIYMTFKQNQAILTERINKLVQYAERTVSVCCNKEVFEKQEGDESCLFCKKCKMKCFTHLIQDLRVDAVLNEYSQRLMDQQETMIKYAEKMGFTVVAPPPIIRQNNLVVVNEAPAEGSPLPQLSPEDVTDLNKLNPQEQRHLSRALSKKIECEVVDTPEEKK